MISSPHLRGGGEELDDETEYFFYNPLPPSEYSPSTEGEKISPFLFYVCHLGLVIELSLVIGHLSLPAPTDSQNTYPSLSAQWARLFRSLLHPSPPSPPPLFLDFPPERSRQTKRDIFPLRLSPPFPFCLQF